MLFNSFIFFVFLGVVLPIFYMLPTKTSRNVFLLISSYFFYGYWDWRFLSLLAISTVADYAIGLAMHGTEDKRKRNWLLMGSLVVNLGILGFFKYFGFFASSFVAMANSMGWHVDALHVSIILPVGISFYTFQTLSYTIDIYRRKFTPTKNFIDFALFVSFFPQLVAGPIERASKLLPQLYEKRNPTRHQLKQGIVLIITGLFRKVLIGDTAGRYADHIFSDLSLYSSWEVIAALVLFSVQIYADFSGYSHIARGTAKLLGIELMKNFEQPYLSRNITEFWRRWHISLSSWLKDYLYISLGGNRGSNRRTYINLMLTMLLGGLWHGASWNFVIWGGLHGFYLAVHKFMLRGKRIEKETAELGSVKDYLTFIFKFTFNNLLVLFTWLFFRATSWDSTKIFFSKLAHWEPSEHSLRLTGVMAAFLLLTLILDSLEYLTGRHTYILMIRSKAVQAGILIAMFLATMAFMFQSDPMPFVYFQF